MKLPELNLQSASASEKQELQRTAEWFESRRGRFTGSRIKDLMGTTRSSSKFGWNDERKILDFSDTALKYVYQVAMERKRGYVVKTQSSLAMNYGTNIESEIREKIGNEYFKNSKVEEVGFMEFIDGIAGASPDGTIILDDVKLGVEIKAATTWDTLFVRTENPLDERHQDFWQVQAEMMALKVDKLLYVVAEPPESIYEPVLMNLQFRYAFRSEIHTKAIFMRCILANKIVEKFLAGNNIRGAYNEVIKETA